MELGGGSSTEALRDDERTSEQAARALVRVQHRHDPQVFIEQIERIYESLAEIAERIRDRSPGLRTQRLTFRASCS